MPWVPTRSCSPWRGATLGEVTARQIPLLPNLNVDRIVVWPGRAEVLAGHDESFVHAELVALCDALLRAAAPSSILVSGFPPVTGRDEQIRLFDAAARSVCELRGIGWQPHPERAHRR